MKKLSVKAFWLILCGLVVTFVSRIIETFRPVNLDTDTFLNAGFTQEQVDQLIEFIEAFSIVVLFILGGLLAYFVFLLLKNKQKETSQKYINFLYVLYIILVIFKALSLLAGDALALIGIVGNGLIIVGAKIQKNYSYRVYDDEGVYHE